MMMMVSHAPEFDVDSVPLHCTRRPLDLSPTGQLDDFGGGGDGSPPDAGGLPRRCYGVAARDNSSSPESPSGVQAGARPKKSPKKHRAL